MHSGNISLARNTKWIQQSLFVYYVYIQQQQRKRGYESEREWWAGAMGRVGGRENDIISFILNATIYSNIFKENKRKISFGNLIFYFMKSKGA